MQQSIVGAASNRSHARNWEVIFHTWWRDRWDPCMQICLPSKSSSKDNHSSLSNLQRSKQGMRHPKVSFPWSNHDRISCLLQNSLCSCLLHQQLQYLCLKEPSSYTIKRLPSVCRPACPASPAASAIGPAAAATCSVSICKSGIPRSAFEIYENTFDIYDKAWSFLASLCVWGAGAL